jgi:hypothetical protein
VALLTAAARSRYQQHQAAVKRDGTYRVPPQPLVRTIVPEHPHGYSSNSKLPDEPYCGTPCRHPQRTPCVEAVQQRRHHRDIMSGQEPELGQTVPGWVNSVAAQRIAGRCWSIFGCEMGGLGLRPRLAQSLQGRAA